MCITYVCARASLQVCVRACVQCSHSEQSRPSYLILRIVPIMLRDSSTQVSECHSHVGGAIVDRTENRSHQTVQITLQCAQVLVNQILLVRGPETQAPWGWKRKNRMVGRIIISRGSSGWPLCCKLSSLEMYELCVGS